MSKLEWGKPASHYYLPDSVLKRKRQNFRGMIRGAKIEKLNKTQVLRTTKVWAEYRITFKDGQVLTCRGPLADEILGGMDVS
jgi:hypothetical protein